jgi:hypothetical protein
VRVVIADLAPTLTCSCNSTASATCRAQPAVNGWTARWSPQRTRSCHRSVRTAHDREPTCQHVVSSDPTRGLASHHGPLSRHLSEQGPLDAEQGGAEPRDAVRMAWHARGQGFKSPQLHPSSTAISRLDCRLSFRLGQQIGSNPVLPGRSGRPAWPRVAPPSAAPPPSLGSTFGLASIRPRGSSAAPVTDRG